MANIAADGSTGAIRMNGNPAKLTINGDFGSGTLALEEQISDGDDNKQWVAVLDGSDVAITYTANKTDVLDFGIGDMVRLTLSGSTNPDIDYQFSFGQGNP
jgi:hypothetical protein